MKSETRKKFRSAAPGKHSPAGKHRGGQKRPLSRSGTRRPRLETLERRLVFTSYVYDPPLIDDSGRLNARDDFRVIAKDSEAIDLDVFKNDTRMSTSDGHIRPGNLIIDFPYNWYPSRPFDPQEVLSDLEFSQADHGTVRVDPETASVTYQPDESFTGVDRFTYTISLDGQTDTANVYINVIDPIYALQDWIRVDEDSQNNVIDVLANDGYNGPVGKNANDELFVASVSQGNAGGTLEISADGKQLIYTPESNFAGKETFSYILEDDLGNQAESTLTVQVTTLDSSGPPQVWNEQIEQKLLESALQRYQSAFGQAQNPASPQYHPWNDVFMVDREILLRGDNLASTSWINATVATTTLQSVSGDADFSTTNTLDDRVDEGDLVKTDGNYLYLISNWTDADDIMHHQMIVSDIRDPSAPAVVARYGLDGPVSELYLLGDRVALLSQHESDATLTVLDVSDRSAPSLIYQSTILGQLGQTRAVGDHIYVIAETGGHLLSPEIESVCYSEESGCFYETAQQYVERVLPQLRDAVVGRVDTQLSDGSITTQSAQFANAMHASGLAHFTLSTLISFDVADDGQGPSDVKSFLHGHSTDIYVSDQSIYFLEDSYSDASKVDPPPPGWLGSPFIAIPWRFDPVFFRGGNAITQIDKISFDDQGTMRWVASGSVSGHVQNGYSANEHDGYLRLMTESTNSSNLHVLQQDGDTLNIVGSVEGLAPNEQIYSARFEGDRAFMVTFRKVDPLFVFDLSDPTDPKVAGELKVTGYSNYLQLIDENTLLGIGREANENGLFQEMQVSLFDISDLETPTLLHRYSFEGGRDLWSPLMQDAWNLGSHQSVNYFASHETLVLPIYDGEGNWWSWAREGTVADVSMRVLDIDVVDGITELGTIDFETPFDPHDARAVRVGDVLFSVSPDLIQAHTLLDPSDKLSEFRIGVGATDDVFVTRGTDRMTMDVLANDLIGEGEQPAKIEVDQPGAGGRVEVADDDQLQFIPDDDFTGKTEFTYKVISETGIAQQATVTVDVKRAWHNADRPMDVNKDGLESGLDLLHIANAINELGGGSIERLDDPESLGEEFVYQVDVNNDGFFTALDFLMMINHFATDRPGEAAGVFGEAAGRVDDEQELPDPVFSAASANIPVTSLANSQSVDRRSGDLPGGNRQVDEAIGELF